MRVLVIGYGNGLRGDDGLGPLAAEQVAAWELPGVSTLAVHQLTPELAAAIAEVETVWFIDAAVEGSGRVVAVAPVAADSRLGHLWSPGVLLSLAKQLYDAEPIAYQLLLPAVDFSYGMTLSAIARAGLAQGLATLKGHLTGAGSMVSVPTTRPSPHPAIPSGQEALCTKSG